jgi:hypothetical protein
MQPEDPQPEDLPAKPPAPPEEPVVFPSADDQLKKLQARARLTGVALGIAYGILAYNRFLKFDALPTSTFLFLVPAIIGAIPSLFSDVDQVNLFQDFVFFPIVTILGFLVATVVLFKEAAVCLVVLAAPVIALGLSGAFLIWMVKAYRMRARKKAKAMAALMLLPFLLVGIEKKYGLVAEELVARSWVVVEAPAAQIWDGLAVVDTIREGEYTPGVFNWLGVPRPIRATVDRAGAGGHRVGEFEFGLRFDEVIETFDPPRRMTFSIAVDPRTLRDGSAEQHAFKTGYFRFIDAAYDLEPLSPVRTRLHLSSRYIVKSGANWYGKIWADAVIRDFQDRVLLVLKARAELARQRLAGAGRVGL